MANDYTLIISKDSEQILSCPLRIADGKFSKFSPLTKGLNFSLSEVKNSGNVVLTLRIVSCDENIVFQDKLILRRKLQVSSIIDSILSSFGLNIPCHADLFVSLLDNSVSVGVMSSKFLPVRCVINNEFKNSTNGQSSYHKNNIADNVASTISDKDLFISHISDFLQLLPESLKNKDEKNKQSEIHNKWIQTISSLQDSKHLLHTFEIASSPLDVWIHLLESWGIKHDKCKKYTNGCIDKTHYNILDDTGEGDYVVVEPYWSIWEYTEQKNKEKVLIKGTVSK